jgi:hypothetical protein
VGLDGQAADVSVQNAAGGSIYHGVPPEQIVPRLAELVEKLATDVRDELGRQYQYRQADYAARELRQNYLDRRLDDLAVDLGATREAVADQMADTREAVAAIVRPLQQVALVLTLQSAILLFALIAAVLVIAALLFRDSRPLAALLPW